MHPAPFKMGAGALASLELRVGSAKFRPARFAFGRGPDLAQNPTVNVARRQDRQRTVAVLRSDDGDHSDAVSYTHLTLPTKRIV